jgi:hypothetical protein
VGHARHVMHPAVLRGGILRQRKTGRREQGEKRKS